MAWIRQLESGKWAATVRVPGDPDRITESFRKWSQAKAWADDQESRIRNGEWVDPRRAKITVAEWWDRCQGARHLEMASIKRDESHWRCHVRPRWGEVHLGAIVKSDVSAWVVRMQKAGVGAATIEGAVGVLRALFEQAIDSEMLRSNPARGVRKPKRDAHVDRVLDRDEQERLLDAMERIFPGRVDARLFTELVLDAGLRWEEAAALPPTMIDTRRQRIHIAWVMERNGTARPYAKSEAGNRTVPYGDALAARLTAAKLAAPAVAGVFPRDEPGRLLFTTPAGNALRYTNWNQRVWQVALAGRPAIGKVRGHAPREAIVGARLDDPQPTCHDLRHTAGSELAEAGLPIHDVMSLLGHGDIRSSQRYLHSSEARFDRARQARARSRTG